MKVRVSMSASLREAVVHTEPSWLERVFLGEREREFFVVACSSPTGVIRWWDDSARRSVTSARVVDALERARHHADREIDGRWPYRKTP